MNHFIIRKPVIDLETPLPRHWCGNDAFRTAFFNALSISFPTGEQFFIDSIKKALVLLPESERSALSEWVRGFIGQETFHRKYHEQFNAQIAAQGVLDCWTEPVKKWQSNIANDDATIWMAVTAALEHFTAILSLWVLQNSNVLAGTEKRLQELWLWHASEEIEHREMALHVFHKINGSEETRIRMYKDVTRRIFRPFMTQIIVNLWTDRTLFKPSTWVSAYRFFFGKSNFFGDLYGPWKAYFRPGFSPAEIDPQEGAAWLAANYRG